MEYTLLLFFLIFLWAYYDTVWGQRGSRPEYIKPDTPTSTSNYTYTDPLDSYTPLDSTALDLYNLDQFRAYKANYLRSNQWHTKRQLVLSRDQHKCIDCNSTTQLEVHHRQYQKLADEPLSHLVTLCRSCHEARHTKLGIPQTYQEYLDFNDIL